MYYREALIKDWNNPKEITVAEIAECIITAPDKELSLMVDKSFLSGRIKSIQTYLNKDLSDTKFNSAFNFASTLRVLDEDLFFEFGGTVVRDKAGAIIYTASDITTWIKTYDEAMLVKEGMKQVKEAYQRHYPNIKTHNWKRDNKDAKAILPKKFKKILTEAVEILLADGGTITKRIKRLSTKLIKLSIPL